eukprot:TRINITY_DN19757_c0_g1_i2.p1 TRINITY_DN19757_c0_g1~~TRINITY_DN19757_c0_g1_i2.p1  ORF type:complete len:218 (+),score=60.01 TRINITY_DN19757_c0_g1_i2:40-693(+)
MESGDAVLAGVLSEVLSEKRELLDACENLRSEERRKKIRNELLREKIEKIRMQHNDFNCREIEINIEYDEMTTDVATKLDAKLQKKAELLKKREELLQKVALINENKKNVQSSSKTESTQPPPAAEVKQSNELAEKRALHEALTIRKKRLENYRKTEELKQQCALLQSAAKGDLHWDHSSALASRHAALTRLLQQKLEAQSALRNEVSKLTPSNVTL